MPPIQRFHWILTIRSFSCFKQTAQNRRFRIPMSMVTSMVGETKTFATPEVLKKTSLTSTFLNILQPLPGLHKLILLITCMLQGLLEFNPHWICYTTQCVARAATTPLQRCLPVGLPLRPPHCALVRFSPDAQSGLNRPLPLRSSGICPDACTQGLRTAHQFASLLMRNPGLTL